MPSIRTGAISAGLAVAAGAFGAHGLKSRVSAEALEVWKTGAHYHLIHALAMLVVIALGARVVRPERVLALFLAGQVVFAGSLYALALTGVKWLGAITPLGGLCFLSGWALLALSAGAQPGDSRR